jgi:hypothetical protein
MDRFVISLLLEAVIVRLDRTIQYSAAPRFYHSRFWNTGSPAFAGDDGREFGALVFTI